MFLAICSTQVLGLILYTFLSGPHVCYMSSLSLISFRLREILHQESRVHKGDSNLAAPEYELVSNDKLQSGTKNLLFQKLGMWANRKTDYCTVLWNQQAHISLSSSSFLTLVLDECVSGSYDIQLSSTLCTDIVCIPFEHQPIPSVCCT